MVYFFGIGRSPLLLKKFRLQKLRMTHPPASNWLRLLLFAGLPLLKLQTWCDASSTIAPKKFLNSFKPKMEAQLLKLDTECPLWNLSTECRQTDHCFSGAFLFHQQIRVCICSFWLGTLCILSKNTCRLILHNSLNNFMWDLLKYRQNSFQFVS